ncbi:MAG: L-galactonate transporter [Syntrophorhabdus sp. PtaB.Bin047]|nr:MAG: L-galactonate transporter [Syntrophorhabdus sp. PtaB.Bin047]
MERYSDLRGRALLFLLFLWLLWFLNFSVRIVLAPILPVVEDEFLVSHARASGIFVLLSVGYGVSVIVSGFLSGRFGYKRSIIFSLALLSLATFLVPFIHTFTLLYLFAFVLGFAVGVYIPSVIPLITEYYSEKDWGKAIAIHDTGASISILTTPFVAIGLLALVPWRGMFVVFACIFLACAIMLCLACAEVRIENPPRAVFSDILRMRPFWIMTALFTFGVGANLGIYSIIPLYLTKELRLSIDYANTILGISRLGSVGVAISCGFLVDRFSLKKIMFPMMAIAGVFTILMGLASVRLTGIVLFLQAVFITGFFPVGLVAIAKIFNREMRGLATGMILAVCMVFGSGIIPYLLGVSGDLSSFRLGIVVLGVLVTLSSALIFGLRGLD